MKTSIQPSTFSIVAHDPQAEEWGIAVQSKFLAAGAVVPWARAKVGAIATQARANMSYGPDGLKMLEEGASAQEVVKTLTDDDDGDVHRQLAIVDADGNAAAYTGEECMDWAGHQVGDGYSCQGNILAAADVVKRMSENFESSEGRLADRLVSALHAGQSAGGDSRGQQAAGLLVVKEGGSYGGYLDKYIDLRVDDHERPIKELERVLNLFYLYFERPDPDNLLPLKGELARQVSGYLKSLGYDIEVRDEFDKTFEKILDAWAGQENFEERMIKPGFIDPEVVKFMRQSAEN